MRLTVARRLDPRVLPMMIGDRAPAIRRVVAARLPAERLFALIHDADPLVRRDAAERIVPDALAQLLDDPDLRVRFVVADRAPTRNRRPAGQRPRRGSGAAGEGAHGRDEEPGVRRSSIPSPRLRGDG